MHLRTSVKAILLVMGVSLVGCSYSPRNVTITSDDEMREVDDRKASRTDGLFLEGPDVTDAAVSEISRFSNLRWLYLRETGVTDAGLEDLPKNMPHLVHLGVPGTSIADAGLAIIVDAAPNLGFIDLSHTKITDEGVEFLLRLPRLQGLDASYTDITTASLTSLGQIRKLDFLNVEGTSISELEVYRLFGLEDEWHRRQEQPWPPEPITVTPSSLCGCQ
ncbi:MAG: hypothetical protein WD534_13660 [Phycisphaeraceae bacterium]